MVIVLSDGVCLFGSASLLAARSNPLESWTRDQAEAGPRSVQWNLALYNDDVLWLLCVPLNTNTPLDRHVSRYRL